MSCTAYECFGGSCFLVGVAMSWHVLQSASQLLHYKERVLHCVFRILEATEGRTVGCHRDYPQVMINHKVYQRKRFTCPSRGNRYLGGGLKGGMGSARVFQIYCDQHQKLHGNPNYQIDTFPKTCFVVYSFRIVAFPYFRFSVNLGLLKLCSQFAFLFLR